ncbi:MAG: hypothetical protein R3E89_13500 [Thiolinea sp.]
MQTKHMPPLAGFIAAALSEGADLGRLAAAVSEYRRGFQQLHFMHDGPVS